MGVTTIVQQTTVDTVGSVVMSAIVQDPSTYVYQRTIQVYSPPDNNGNITLQFTLTLSGATMASVELSSPSAITVNAPSGTI